MSGKLWAYICHFIFQLFAKICLTYRTEKIYFALKMCVDGKNVNQHLHILPLANVIKNDWETHLACHIPVVRKVVRNFTNSFMKQAPGPSRMTLIWHYTENTINTFLNISIIKNICTYRYNLRYVMEIRTVVIQYHSVTNDHEKSMRYTWIRNNTSAIYWID